MVPFQGSLQGPTSAFVTKLNATGSGLVYSTYLGSITEGHAIAVDPAGAAYITGKVDVFSGGSVPVTPGAVLDTPAGSFATKVAANGSLGYSTYLPISGGSAIAVDPAGHAYVAGSPGGRGNVWIRKLNPTGTAFLYSAMIGGSGSFAGTFETAGGIALDAEGNAYVTGSTASPDFPTTPGAFKQSGPGSLGTTGIGAFVTKLGPTGSRLYSTLLAGDRGEEAFGIAVDLAGHAYVTGYTLSSNFPTTPGAFQTTRRGGQDAFVTKFKPDGSGLVYSTLLNGRFEAGSAFAASSSARGIAVDPTGSAHVAGSTRSGDFPATADAFQPTLTGAAGTDAFLTKLNTTGSGLLYSSYLGGSGVSGQRDEALAIALDVLGDAYITGWTNASVGFPTTPLGFLSPFQKLNAGGSDAFVTKFSTGTPTVFSISTILPSAGGDTGTVSAVIHGTAIAQGATARLMRAGQPEIGGGPAAVGTDGRNIAATFDLTGKAPGPWDVVVTNPDRVSVTLAGAFTTEEGRVPEVCVDVVGRDAIMLGRAQPFYIVYGNRGDVDAFGSIVVTGIPQSAKWELGLDPPLLNGAPIPWGQISTQVEINGQIVLSLPFSVVSPGFVDVVKLLLTSNTFERFELAVLWVGQ